jgi:hypothetical protein
MDRLSLALCCTKPPFDALELGTHAGATLTKIRIGKPEARRITLDPWPFGTGRIEVSINAKTFPATPFKDEATFQAAYTEAPVERLTFELTAS